MRTLVNAAATADATIAALTSNDPQQISRRERAMIEQIGYAERIDIIRIGEAQVELDSDVPISYAMLDLIKRAESQEFVGPESAIAQEGLVYAAQPILLNGVPEGVLFVVFDANRFLQDPVAGSLLAKSGQGRILQKVESGSDEQSVFKLGDAGAGAVTITTPLEVRQWQLEFTPNEQRLADLAGIGNAGHVVLNALSLSRRVP